VEAKDKRSEKKSWPRRLLRRCIGESGATFMEYAMLAALIAIGVAVAVSAWGGKLINLIGASGTQADNIANETNAIKNLTIPEAKN